MTLLLEPYVEQLPHWPRGGRHILAQFDDESVVVYQAYRPEIGRYAAAHGAFGAGFSFSRMPCGKRPELKLPVIPLGVDTSAMPQGAQAEQARAQARRSRRNAHRRTRSAGRRQQGSLRPQAQCDDPLPDSSA